MRIIAGPCQHESYEQSLAIARECQRVCNNHNVEFIFKASFDKANRSSDNSKRGVGIDQTLQDFRKIKSTFPSFKMLTDVHEKEHVNIIQTVYFDVIDVIQIPAFLCRQTDLLKHACRTGKIINIKKGQFLAPWDMKGILQKTADAKTVWITERGTSFGYNTLITDFTGVQYMKQEYPVPIIFDATHSVQKPGGMGTASGGNREYVPGLIRAAVVQGVDGVFLECHHDPDSAPSDGPNMVKMEHMKTILSEICLLDEIEIKYNYD